MSATFGLQLPHLSLLTEDKKRGQLERVVPWKELPEQRGGYGKRGFLTATLSAYATELEINLKGHVDLISILDIGNKHTVGFAFRFIKVIRLDIPV